MIILTILFIYLILGEGIFGKLLYTRLTENIQINRNARVLFYMRTMILMWGLTIIMLVTTYLMGISFTEYGLKLPNVNFESMNDLEKIAISVLIGACMSMIIQFIAMKKSGDFQRHIEKQMSSVSEMLPTNYRESLLWILICMTAGITEELLFRSFMMYYLAQLFPWLSTMGVLMVSSIIFGVAHIYQGWKGVVGTMFLGFLLGWLYITIGSIYPSMLLHIIIDLLVLVRLFILKGKVIFQSV
ncbi:CPBP family intramembrane glutamic endopeptidase [Bacillus sp. C1]